MSDKNNSIRPVETRTIKSNPGSETRSIDKESARITKESLPPKKP